MSVLIQGGRNKNKPYTVRYWLDNRQRERSFETLREAREFKVEVDRVSQHIRDQQHHFSLIKKEGLGLGLFEVPVHGAVYVVYRLWDKANRCLYIGQSTQCHPILRIIGHRTKPWWNEVARCDCLMTLPEELDQIEMDQIHLYEPIHNKIRRVW